MNNDRKTYLQDVPLTDIVKSLTPCELSEAGNIARKSKGQKLSDSVTGWETGLEEFSYKLEAGQALIDHWRNKMIDIDFDTVRLEIHDWKDKVLLTLSYGKIIGSHWLAIVPKGEVLAIVKGAK